MSEIWIWTRTLACSQSKHMFDSFTCPCYTICKERRCPLTVSLWFEAKKQLTLSCGGCFFAFYLSAFPMPAVSMQSLHSLRLHRCGATPAILTFLSSVFCRHGGMDFIISITSSLPEARMSPSYIRKADRQFTLSAACWYWSSLICGLIRQFLVHRLW